MLQPAESSPPPAATLAPPPDLSATVAAGMAATTAAIPTPTATPRPTPTPRPTATPTPDPLSQYQGIKKAIAALTVYIETPDGTGSGFFYDLNLGTSEEADWAIVTNRHVVGNHSGVRICSAVHQKCVDGTVIAKGSATFDVAVVDYAQFTDTRETAQFLERTLRNIWNGWGGRWQKGDIVYAAGYPGGNRSRQPGILSDPVVTEGTINDAGTADWGDEYYIEHGADIEPGSSGGPLMNSSGVIIGINTALSRQHERLELAVPMAEFMGRFNPGSRQGTIEISAGETEYIPLDQMRAGQVCQYGFNVRQQGSVDIRFSLTDKNGAVIHSGGRTAGETGEFRVDRTGNYLVFDNAYSLFASKTVDLAINCRR